MLYDAIPINRIAGHLLQAARAAVDAIVDAGQVRVGYDLFPFLDAKVTGISVDDFIHIFIFLNFVIKAALMSAIACGLTFLTRSVFPAGLRCRAQVSAEYPTRLRSSLLTYMP